MVGGELKALMRAVKRVTGGSSAAVEGASDSSAEVDSSSSSSSVSSSTAATVLPRCTHHIAMFTVQATAEQSIGGG